MVSNNRIYAWVAQSPPAVRWLLLGSLVIFLDYINRFVQDDAFISFRYAQHLIESHGLVWNIGESVLVEGYSNFLWVLLIAVGLWLGVAPDVWSMVLGFAAAAGTLRVADLLALRLTAHLAHKLACV